MPLRTNVGISLQVMKQCAYQPVIPYWGIDKSDQKSSLVKLFLTTVRQKFPPSKFCAIR